MTPTLSNLAAVSLQIVVVAGVAGAAFVMLRLRAPAVRYACWRAVLVLCLALPFLQPPQRVMVGEPAGAATMSFSVADDTPAARAPAVPTPVDWPSVLIAALIAGALARFAWLGLGLRQLSQLRHLGAPLADCDHADLQGLVGVRADVRYAREVAQPVTFGLRHPLVLLPESLRDQSAAVRGAVLAHELIHVKRRDWVWVVAEELLRAVLWFHPAVWWLISRVQLAREEVVDAAAVALTGRRREYVEALLTFADAAPLAPAAAFARRRHLFRRIVLISTEDPMSARRLVVSAFVMAALVALSGWYAVQAFPIQIRPLLIDSQGPLEQSARPITPDNPIPRRVRVVDPVYPPGDLARAMSVAVTLRATVDNRGAVAELRLAALSFRPAAASQVTMPDGRTMAVHNGGISIASGSMRSQLDRFFSMGSVKLRAGAPAVDMSVLRPAVEAFINAAAQAVSEWQYDAPHDAPISFDVSVQFANGIVNSEHRVAAVSAERLSADGALRVGGNIRPPTKVRDVRPVYPPEAQEQRIQGVVIADVRIEGDGRVGEARILRSIPALDAAALDAVRQWQFTPTLLNGVAVPVIMTVTIQFSLAP